jgi:hypothetical protein
VTRWLVRIVLVAAVFAMGVGGLYLTLYVIGRNPAIRNTYDALSATNQLRAKLGRDAHVKVRQLEDDGTDDDLELTVVYPANTPLPERKDLYSGTNIIVRRHVSHVREVKVVFGEEAPAAVEAPLADGGVAAAAPAPQPPPAPGPGPAAPRPVAPAAPATKKASAPKPKGPGGTFTLVTFPNATVLRGKQNLGTTPLFNVELPVGTHLLTLVGDDGSHHALSVQVKAGKNPPMKVNLADIPNSR